MVKFIISSELFQGFIWERDHNEIISLEVVASEIKRALLVELERLHLHVLVEKAKQLDMHYHDYTILDVLSSPDDRVFYLCDHCSKN